MTRALRCQNKHALTTHSLGDTPISATAEYVFQTGISPASHETYAVDETLTHCPVSHELLDVQYEWDKLPVPSSLRALVVAASGLFFAALLVFITLASKPGLAEMLYERTIRRFLPESAQVKLDGFIYRFMEGLYFFRNSRDVIMVFVTSVFIWLMETAKYWFVMQAFVHMDAGFPVPFFVLMLMNGIVNLATTLPSAPGYIGTFDAPGVAVLTAYGVKGSVAFGYTIVLHAALWVPITLLGAWYFRRAQVSWTDVETAQMQSAQGA